MVIRDKIYGNFTITEPLAIELVNTSAFQRLMGVSQYGIPDRYYYRQGYSRYDHCLGVYILLNRFGASPEEQVAGLLHDVSHTAFSHVIDFVVGGDRKNEDYQDKAHLSVLERPELERVLIKYGTTPAAMADYHSFRLLEREIPDLCADRIDYSLRQMELSTAGRCLSGLAVREGKFVFADEARALLFANNFLKLQMEDWAGYETTTRYELLARILKSALDEGDINMDDFWTTDDLVLGKLYATGKKEYLEILDLLEKRDLSSLSKAKEPSMKKFRYVDPKVLIGDKTQRLSEINNDFKKRLADAQALNAMGVHPGIIA